MPLYKTDAVVLKADDFGEAHRLVTLLTPLRGTLRAVAKGVRRPTSRLAGALLPFTHCRLLLWEGRTLDGISQAEIAESFRPLREDLGRMAGALYACELAAELIPEGPGGEREGAAAFRLLLAVLGQLAYGPRADLATRYCELHLLRLGGFGPRLEVCAGCGVAVGTPVWFSPTAGGCLCRGCAAGAAAGPTASAPAAAGSGGVLLGRAAVAGAHALIRARPGELGRLPVTPAAAEELGAALEGYLRHVLQKKLKSLDFLDILKSPKGHP